MEDSRIKGMEDYLNSPAYEADVRRLMAGDYFLSIPEKKMIPKGYTNRKRAVYHFEDHEMTLLRMMSFCLHDYEDLFPKEVYSFKKGISAKDFIFRICADPRYREMYVAKTDIIEYGNSIDAKILITFLEKDLGERPGSGRLFPLAFEQADLPAERGRKEGGHRCPSRHPDP